MNIKNFTQIFSAHRRAFQMPPGKSYWPRWRPFHDVCSSDAFIQIAKSEGDFFRLGSLNPIGFLPSTLQQPFHLVDHMGFILNKLDRIKIDRTIFDISISSIQDCIDHFYLFYDMTDASGSIVGGSVLKILIISLKPKNICVQLPWVPVSPVWPLLTFYPRHHPINCPTSVIFLTYLTLYPR